ncbi:unnamed protein product [Arctia plantaginis]|uniref:Uncharacterized protein n=1 Tax=Arctia plantaginis TaxID=874455 RepID=A0A8S1B314_ARCPL|nr:unnamed protein product [Arctia plantaginis]
MMGMLWVVLLVALTGSHLGHCSPLRSTPQTYPHDIPRPLEGWGSEGGLYAAVPALAFVLTAVGLLFGCTWCYRHKDCKKSSAQKKKPRLGKPEAIDSISQALSLIYN